VFESRSRHEIPPPPLSVLEDLVTSLPRSTCCASRNADLQNYWSSGSPGVIHLPYSVSPLRREVAAVWQTVINITFLLHDLLVVMAAFFPANTRAHLKHSVTDSGRPRLQVPLVAQVSAITLLSCSGGGLTPGRTLSELIERQGRQS
jgi:hypothetical protein